MNTVTGSLVADSRAMHLAHDVAQPSLWQMVIQRLHVKEIGTHLTASWQANALRRHAQGMHATDRRLAADLCAAADMHERQNER